MLRPSVAACVLVVCLSQTRAENARDEIARLTNELRKSEKLPPLKVNEQLARAAQKHAENMARQGKLEHKLDGKTPLDRAKKEGYTKPVAENVAGQSRAIPAKAVAARMVRGWEKSPGHRRNMLRKEIAEIGVGLARSASGAWYGCQVFGVDIQDFEVSLCNKTPQDVMFRWKGKEGTTTIEPGATVTMKARAPVFFLVLEFLPEKKDGNIFSLSVGKSATWNITSDGKGGYKAEEAK